MPDYLLLAVPVPEHGLHTPGLAVKGIAERNSSQMGQLRHPKGKGLA